jgi:FOG: TPR repeat
MNPLAGVSQRFSWQETLKSKFILIIRLSAVLFCVWTWKLSAADESSLFDSGNKFYEQGKYADAIAAYEKIRQSGMGSSALFFNLGNAYFKQKQTGRAIIAYRMAKELSPRDADIRANLEFARKQIQGPTVARIFWDRWLDWFSLNEWTVAASLFVWLFFVLLALRQSAFASPGSLRTVLVGVGVISFILLGCLGMVFHERRISSAIIVSDMVVAHKGPLDESPPAFTVHDGAELRLLDTKGDWFQVALDSRRIGWLRVSDAKLVRHF